MNFIYIIFTFLLLCSFSVKNAYSNYSTHFLQINQNDTIMKKDTINLIAVGDIMMGTNFPNKSYLPSNDGADLFNNVISHLNCEYCNYVNCFYQCWNTSFYFNENDESFRKQKTKNQKSILVFLWSDIYSQWYC